ncbi:MAG: dephospho-CoA kinase [Candidatus Cloacimonetes bacterium]|nr:dephospho-CoA kinase [Candidatus Cloacimonadota bacterium]
MKPNNEKKAIAITGSIGSGKTTVCEFLEHWGFSIISADKLGHDVLELPSIIRKLCSHFGNDIMVYGKIDRQILGNRVFLDPDGTRILSELMHPAIIEMIDLAIAAGDNRTVFEIPLLFEKRLNSKFALTILVTAKENIRLERIMQRPGMTYEKARGIINSQLPDSAKEKLSDYVIRNDGNMEELKKKLTDLVKDLLLYTGELQNA